MKRILSKNLKLKTKNWSLNCLLPTAYFLLLLLFVLLMIALPFPLSKGGVGVVEASAAWTIEAVEVDNSTFFFGNGSVQGLLENAE